MGQTMRCVHFESFAVVYNSKLVYGCQVYWIADALMSLIYDCILIYLLIEVENTDAVFNDSVSILIFVKITFENNRFMT